MAPMRERKARVQAIRAVRKTPPARSASAASISAVRRSPHSAALASIQCVFSHIVMSTASTRRIAVPCARVEASPNVKQAFTRTSDQSSAPACTAAVASTIAPDNLPSKINPGRVPKRMQVCAYVHLPRQECHQESRKVPAELRSHVLPRSKCEADPQVCAQSRA